MARHFQGGSIYLGNGTYSTDLFVSDEGLICSEEEYLSSDAKASISLDGKMLLPGFRDTHAHPLFAGREAQGLDITGLKSIQQIGEALRNHQLANPHLRWLDAAVYDRSIAGDQSRQTLDAFVSSIPVVLHAEDHHTLWVNTKALAVAGLLSKPLPELSAGRIDIDEYGVPTGILREWEAMSQVLDLAPQNSHSEDVDALLWAEKQLISFGIVECQDAWIDRGMAEVYVEAANSGRLQLHYRLAFRADVKSFEEDFGYFLQQRDELSKHKQLKGQAIKFFVDGVFGSATASVAEPYLSTKTYGELNWSKSSLVEAISMSHSNGFQTHLHAIGDAGVAFALECLAEAIPSPAELNPVIAHAELTSQDLLAKAKKLNVNLCVQPFWAQNNGMLLSCRHHLGDERLGSLYAFRDMIESGINLSFSSDWPVSTPSVLQGMAVAVFRQGSKGMEVHNRDQAISVNQAIDAYTTSAARLLGSNHDGTLSISEPFDAVLIDRDLNEQDLDGFLSAKVLAIYKVGKDLLVEHQH